MKLIFTPAALWLASFLALSFPVPGAAANPQGSLATSATPGPSFESFRLGLVANAPAQCTAPLYGTITARSPDGALCLCHQGYDGAQSLWEQIGTGRPCWPDKK